MKQILFFLALTSVLFGAEVIKKQSEKKQVKVNKEVEDYLTSKNKELSKIVAKINGIVIKQSDVIKQASSKLQKTFRHSKISKEKQKEYNKKALEELIEKELLYAYAKKNNILVKKEKIDELKNSIIEKFKSKEEFDIFIKKKGYTEESIVREIDVGESMVLIYDQKIKTELTDDDLKKYYDENTYKFKRPIAKKIQIITVHIDPTRKDSIETARKKITEAYELVKGGKDFGDIAVKYSQDMYRIKGGHLGFVHKGTNENLDKTAFDLKGNVLSEVFQEEIQFYFYKILDTKPELQFKFDDVKEKLKKDLKKRMEKENYDNIISSQKKIMKVELF